MAGQIRLAVMGAMLAGLLLVTTVVAQEEQVSVGEILADPDRYLDEVVTLSGTVEAVDGNDITLSDGTGSLVVGNGPPWHHRIEIETGEAVTITGKIEQAGPPWARRDTVEMEGCRIVGGTETIEVRDCDFKKPPWAGGPHKDKKGGPPWAHGKHKKGKKGGPPWMRDDEDGDGPPWAHGKQKKNKKGGPPWAHGKDKKDKRKDWKDKRKDKKEKKEKKNKRGGPSWKQNEDDDAARGYSDGSDDGPPVETQPWRWILRLRYLFSQGIVQYFR